MSENTTCKRCGNIITLKSCVRCPRCNALLLTSCSGNCGACQTNCKKK